MRLRDPDFSFRTLWNASKRMRIIWFGFIALWIVLFASYSIVFWSNRNATVELNQQKLALEAFFDKLDQTKIRSALNTIDELYGSGILKPDGIDALNSEIVRQLSDSDTAYVATLETVPSSDTYYFVWAPILIVGGFLLLMNIIFLQYSIYSIRRAQFLMDLPWSHSWTKLFVIATALPFGWMAYWNSWLNLRREKRFLIEEANHRALVRAVERIQEERRAAGQIVAAAELAVHTPNPVESVEILDTRNGAGTYPKELGVSLRTYIQLRTGQRYKVVQSRIAALSELLATTTNNVTLAHQQLREHQQNVNIIRAELDNLRSIPAEGTDSDLKIITGEFEQMLRFPGVVGVMVENSSLTFFVEPRVRYQGATYDLGDWEIYLALDGTVSSRERRSGAQESFLRRYGKLQHPHYRERDGSFCFGSRRQEIQEHLIRGQLPEALEVIVNCLSSINPEDLKHLPIAFKEITCNPIQSTGDKPA